MESQVAIISADIANLNYSDPNIGMPIFINLVNILFSKQKNSINLFLFIIHIENINLCIHIFRYCNSGSIMKQNTYSERIGKGPYSLLFQLLWNHFVTSVWQNIRMKIVHSPQRQNKILSFLFSWLRAKRVVSFRVFILYTNNMLIL